MSARKTAARENSPDVLGPQEERAAWSRTGEQQRLRARGTASDVTAWTRHPVGRGGRRGTCCYRLPAAWPASRSSFITRAGRPGRRAASCGLVGNGAKPRALGGLRHAPTPPEVNRGWRQRHRRPGASPAPLTWYACHRRLGMMRRLPAQHLGWERTQSSRNLHSNCCAG